MTDVQDNEPLGVDGLAAVLGVLVLHATNSEIRIPSEHLAEGLPEDSQLRIDWDEKTNEMLITVVAAA